ncbi:MAG: DUF6062 family protein [Lachnospiraceae bacterium]|nr:DUF6062 family protein [Lachnospiraceae bacterium]
MKEKLYTIPLNDAINAQDECPFCFIEDELEKDQIDFVLGSCASYMESDVREITDREGFCRAHFKKMFDYGNTLGNAWILKTHYMKIRSDFHKKTAGFVPGKKSFADKLRSKGSSDNPLVGWLRETKDSCYICNHNGEIFERYMDTFFILYKQDPEFKQKVLNSKGFCLSHFGDLCEGADKRLSGKELQDFYDAMIPLMEKNLDRLQEDVSWLVEKFDYLNKDADWKNSKDANQRGMQKLKGGHPANPPYKQSK